MTRPTIALIDGHLYGYGDTWDACRAAFREQISGGDRRMRYALGQAIMFRTVSPDHASDVAEMLAAEAIEWEDGPVHIPEVSDADRRFDALHQRNDATREFRG